MLRSLVVGLLTLLVLPGCRTLPTIDKGVCGNAVIEPGEDCDRFAPDGSLCRPPGEVDACRYDCSVQPAGPTPLCPHGFKCGEDGVCRWPSGAFEINHVTFAASPQQLDVADLDHDGREDLVVTEQARVAVKYFGDGAAPQAELDIPISPGPSPAIARLTDDKLPLPDVVVDYGGGITVALSNTDRSLVSTAYPSLEAPAAVSNAVGIAGSVLPPPGIGVLLLANLKGVTGSFLVHAAPDALDVLGSLKQPINELSTKIAVGPLDEDPARSPCNDLLMPFRGADRLYEFSPCTRDSGGQVVVNKKAADQPVLLPKGDSVIGPLTLLDLDGDGHLDLAVGVADSSGHGIDTAYGVGDGTFNSTTPVPSSHGDDVASRAVDIKQSVPLAIGDLDGDGVPDYVDAQGVYVTLPTEIKLVGQADSEGFSEAVIADLNENGKPDVVAANADQSGAVFFNGAGGGLLNRFDVPTEGPLSHLCIGDFDGDLLDDVAAVQRTSDGDLLSVLFGNAYGAPDPPLREGLLEKVHQVISNRSTAANVYALNSIATVSEAKDGSLDFADFGGRGDRVLRASFVTTQGTKAGLQLFVPVRLAAGQFDGNAHKDVAELTGRYPGTPEEYRLWLTPMTGRAAIQLSDPLSSDPLPSDVDWYSSEMASGNLDGRGTDELVLLAPLKKGSGSRGYVAHAADTGDGHYVFKLGKPLGLKWRFEHTEGQTVAAGDSGGGRIAVADVDADGRADVVALAPASGPDKGELVVFHGQGTAALGTPEVIESMPHVHILAFTMLQADRDPALELALLEGSEVYIADIGSDGQYHVKSPAVIDLGNSGVLNARLIAAGDFDGDGVEDIAVGNATSVAIFPGVSGTH